MKMLAVIAVMSAGLAATGVGYWKGGTDLTPAGALALPSLEPAFERIEYNPETGRLDVVLVSGRVCEFAGVPPEIVERLVEVEDHATWFLRVLLAEYPLVRMGVTP
jgi:hypothetical protein